MAKSTSPKPPQTNGWVQSKFINYSLSKEQKAEIKAIPWDIDIADDTLIKLTEANYKVTFSWDEYGECYACHLIPKGDKHDNAGFILGGRGSTPTKALKQVCFMHYNVFEENWSEFYNSKGHEDLDD